ncbi:MAG: hypothetical protein WC292_04360 [Clostridia bacterium]
MSEDKGKEMEFAKTFLTGSSIVSANEYTGMVATAIDSEEEAEVLSEDFNIPEQKESDIK